MYFRNDPKPVFRLSRQTLARENSTASHGYDAASKGPVVREFTKGGKRNLIQLLLLLVVTPRQRQSSHDMPF